MASRAAVKSLRVGMLNGDGIGGIVLPVRRRTSDIRPDREQAAQRVLEAVKGIPKPSLVELPAGFEHFQKTGVALPPETVQTLKDECNCAMFGAVSSPSTRVAGYSSPIVQLRKELDLYANIRPVKSVSGTPGRQVDMTIVRENTECLYIKKESISDTPDGKVAIATRQISERASRRIGRAAFEVALAGKAVRERMSAEARAAAPGPKVRSVTSRAC